MSNPIPPFVCSTPPPIDCVVDVPPPVDDDFGDFAAVDDQFEVSSLPVTPVHVAKVTDDNASTAIQLSTPPSPDSGLNFTPEDDNERVAVETKSIEQDKSPFASYAPATIQKDLKNDLSYIIEANSPPPLDFESVVDDDDDEDITPCDDLDNDNDDDGVDEFPVDDDVGKYDDNISLPSLKFDSLSNISKSTTPVSDELIKSNNEDSDSISAFQPIGSGNSDEEPNVYKNIESTEKASTEEVDVKAISFEELILTKDSLSLANKEHEDDFTEFEAFPVAPLQIDFVPENVEPPEDDLQAKELHEDSGFAFEADFSQFSSFEPAAVEPSTKTIQNTPLTEKSSLDDLDADDFDDFQDFAAPPVPVVEQRKSSLGDDTVQQPSTESIHNSDEEDDFGEFSEVVESSTASKIPSSNNGFNLKNLNEKLKPILEMMFPYAANTLEGEEASPNDLRQLTNSPTTTTTTTTINQIDTAKALEYQWNNSEMRHSLIKSLGVDSRNILYGEKWNSSMPRYAANLSFNPLEPMKSDKASGSSSSSTSTTIDYRKRSDSLTAATTTTTSTNKADVPAVEFDWNSSGLVNPLDASQAHTLLLDLDQLVVVANLDKINLDSSCSSPCFATPSTSLLSTVTTTGAASDAASTHSNTVTQSHAGDALLAIDVPQPRLQNDLLLITMPSSPPTSSLSSALLLPSQCNPYVFVSGTCRTETFLTINNDKPTNDHVTNCTTTTTTTTTNVFANLGSNDHNFNQYLDCRVKEILHERTIETIHTPQLGESHPPVDQQSNSALNSNSNICGDSDKPQLRRFPDEETIPAPIEFKSNADASATISAATTAPATTTTATALPDDYIDITGGDFHQHHHSRVLETNIDTVIANTQALHQNKTHAAKYQESSKTDLETELQQSGVVTTSTYAGPLKETHIFTPSKIESILARTTSKTTPRTSESKCPIDFDYEIAAAGIIIDETVVKKEYRDLEYNPGFGLKYREEADYNHSPSPPEICLNGPYQHRTQPIAEKLAELDDFSDFVSVVSDNKSPGKKSTTTANVPNSNSFDDEFSDFQSVPAPSPAQPTIVPSAVIPSSIAAVEAKTSPSHLRNLKESERSASGSRTGTPVSLSDEMILSPAILLPQAIQMESKPTIEWPEPGINPEELARIEELFPQQKISSNKPSPSHSAPSRSQHQQQSRATPQSGADDDDWSEFVSVPASANHIQSISQQFQKRQVSPAKSVADSNDEEWSDFVSSAPSPAVAANQLRQSMYPQFNSAAWQNANFYNNPMSAYASPPTSFYYQAPPPPQQQQQQQNLSNNFVPNLSNINNNSTATNNNIINNNSINQYLINNQANHLSHHPHHQQHIQMMRDFSSASPMDGGSLSSHMAGPPSIPHQYGMQTTPAYGYKNNRGGNSMPHHGKSSQFAGGSSKVAPSISLIPDLGFVAPTHTSFISVPKNSLITKK